MAYAQPPKKTGLPREVLKWLQSLDLSCSPKNVRRDFSNGYVVAEILSLYYPDEFLMHSYDTGTSLKTKQGNWTLIERFLQKLSINLLKEVIDGTVHCKPGAAEILVQEIYMILTNRRIKSPQDVELDFTDRSYQQHLPMVARSTISKAIKNNLRLTEVIAHPNINTNRRKVEAIIHMHLEQRATERLQDPKRFEVRATLGEQAARMVQTPLQPDKNMASSRNNSTSKAYPSSIRSGSSVCFKEVEVRQTDRRSMVFK